MNILSSKLLLYNEPEKYKLYFLNANSGGTGIDYTDAKDLGLSESIISPSKIIATEDDSTLNENCPYYIINGNLYYLNSSGLNLVNNSGSWTCITNSIGINGGNLYSLNNGVATRLIIPASAPAAIEDGKWTRVTCGYNYQSVYYNNYSSFGINNGYLYSIYCGQSADNTIELTAIDSTNKYKFVNGGYSSSGYYGIAITEPDAEDFSRISILTSSGIYAYGDVGNSQGGIIISGAPSSNGDCAIGANTSEYSDGIYRIPYTGSGTQLDSTIPTKIVGYLRNNSYIYGGAIGDDNCPYKIYYNSVDLLDGSGNVWDDVVYGGQSWNPLFLRGGQVYVDNQYPTLNNCIKLCGHGNGNNYTHVLAVCEV